MFTKALHTDGVECTLSVGREVKIETRVQAMLAAETSDAIVGLLAVCLGSIPNAATFPPSVTFLTAQIRGECGQR